MPRLSPLQWLIVALFLGFYGFAVFALTRDYYLRNPPRVAAAPQAPHAMPGGAAPTWIQRQVQGGGDPIPSTPTGTDPAELGGQADILFSQKRYDEAIAYYRRILELAPEDADAHNDLGLALYYTGRSAEALEILEAGTGKAPDFQRIWLTYGYVSANAAQPDQARAALQKARDLDPGSDVAQEAERLMGLLAEP